MDKWKRLADEFQRREIIPHCPRCTRPCCKLTDVVLDLTWKQTQALYQIKRPRRAFDASLHDGSGPAHIQEHHGRYFAHGAPCPAYRPFVDGAGGCSVYGSDVKPEGCSDFPIYKDGDGLTADTRCEAVDVEALARFLEAALGRAVEKSVDAQFDNFVTFD